MHERLNVKLYTMLPCKTNVDIILINRHFLQGLPKQCYQAWIGNPTYWAKTVFYPPHAETQSQG